MSSIDSVVAAVASLCGTGLPGLEVVDRDLSIGADRRVALVVVDAGGRMLFVLVCEPPHDEIAGAASAALAFARSHVRALAKHFAAPRLRPELDPEVWIVAREFSSSARARLACLDARFVRAFELVRFESKRGTAEQLSEITLGDVERPSAPALVASTSSQHSVDAKRPLLEAIVERLRHLDESTQTLRSAAAIEWRIGGDVIGSLTTGNGVLAGRVPGVDQSTSIDSSDAVERFLDSIVRRYLGVVQFDEAETASIAGHGPLLTPEELAAFEIPR